MKKKLFILLLLFYCQFLFSFDANVTGYWFLTETAKAYVGGSSFDGTNVGSPTFDATNGLTGFSDANYVTLPIADDLNGYSTWGIGLVVHQATESGGYQMDEFFCTAAYTIDFANYNTTGAPWEIRMNNLRTWGSPVWAPITTEGYIAVEWNGTQYQIYKEATPFSTPYVDTNKFTLTDVFQLGKGNDNFGDYMQNGGYIKKVYLYNNNRSGVEPSNNTATFTPTNTPTDTITPTPTITTTSTNTATPVLGSWVQVAPHAAFGVRMFPAACVFNNKMWIIGGEWFENSGDPTSYLNDVWYSSNGADWTAATRNAEFPARMRHNVYVQGGYMWVVSGQTAGLNSNDVWYSSNGVVWTQATAGAAFLARRGQMVGNITDNSGNKWILTGQNGSDIMKDAWFSFNGVDWTAATQNAESGWRSGGAGAWFNNFLWIVGGNGDLSTTDFHAWSSPDGAAWTQRGTVFDKQIQHNNLTTAQNILFSLSGSNQGNGLAYDFVKYTLDGDTWLDAPDGFGVRSAGASVYFQGYLWIMAGMNKDTNASATLLDDVWKAPLNSPVTDLNWTGELKSTTGIIYSNGLIYSTGVQK